MAIIILKQFDSYRTYIHYEDTHDSTWMAKVFSWKVWCMILFMYIMLTVCSFWSQIVLAWIENRCKNTNFGEHLFYNFGMLCGQSMNEQFEYFIPMFSFFNNYTFIITFTMKLNNNADITCYIYENYVISFYISFTKKKRKIYNFLKLI